MKLVVAVLLTVLLAFIGGLFLPWWCLAIASFFVAIIVHQKAWKAFISGFMGVFLLWGGLAWWIDMGNNSILSKKIATILPLGGNAVLLILVSAIVGGLIAGVAAMSGSYLRSSGK